MTWAGFPDPHGPRPRLGLNADLELAHPVAWAPVEPELTVAEYERRGLARRRARERRGHGLAWAAAGGLLAAAAILGDLLTGWPA